MSVQVTAHLCGGTLVYIGVELVDDLMLLLVDIVLLFHRRQVIAILAVV